MDHRLFALINGWAGRSRALDAAMIFWADHSPTVFALLLALLWLTWRFRFQLGGFIAAGSAFLALGIGQILGHAIPRTRPFATPGEVNVHLLIPHVADASFPSDHTTLAFALTVALWRVDRRLGFTLLLFSLWLMIARVYIGAHYPSDVIGGAVLGAVTVVIVRVLIRRTPLGSLVVWLFNLLRRWHLAARTPPSIDAALEELTHA